jgi:hypothetical protein
MYGTVPYPKRLDPNPVQLFRIGPDQSSGSDRSRLHSTALESHQFFLLWNVPTCRLIDCWVRVTLCFVFPCSWLLKRVDLYITTVPVISLVRHVYLIYFVLPFFERILIGHTLQVYFNNCVINIGWLSVAVFIWTVYGLSIYLKIFKYLCCRRYGRGLAESMQTDPEHFGFDEQFWARY